MVLAVLKIERTFYYNNYNHKNELINFKICENLPVTNKPKYIYFNMSQNHGIFFYKKNSYNTDFL